MSAAGWEWVVRVVVMGQVAVMGQLAMARVVRGQVAVTGRVVAMEQAVTDAWKSVPKHSKRRAYSESSGIAESSYFYLS
jgi:hypothetical protein